MTSTPTTRASLLLRLCDSQDHEAWVEFVTLYEPVVYRLLRQNGLQDADARDVMQELFLTVSRNIDRWDPAKDRGSFRGWLRRVVRNLVINWLKQSRAARRGGRWFRLAVDARPLARGRRSGNGRIRSRVANAPCFSGPANECEARSSRQTWQAFWETSMCRTFADRRSGEARHDGRGSAGGQVPRVGPPAGGRRRNGGDHMTSGCSIADLELALGGQTCRRIARSCFYRHLEECEACGAALERDGGRQSLVPRSGRAAGQR